MKREVLRPPCLSRWEKESASILFSLLLIRLAQRVFSLSLSSLFTLHVLFNATRRHSCQGIPRRIIIPQFRRHAAHRSLFFAANSAGVPDRSGVSRHHHRHRRSHPPDGTATTFYAMLKTASRRFLVEGRVGSKPRYYIDSNNMTLT